MKSEEEEKKMKKGKLNKIAEPAHRWLNGRRNTDRSYLFHDQDSSKNIYYSLRKAKKAILMEEAIENYWTK